MLAYNKPIAWFCFNIFTKISGNKNVCICEAPEHLIIPSCDALLVVIDYSIYIIVVNLSL